LGRVGQGKACLGKVWLGMELRKQPVGQSLLLRVLLEGLGAVR
jgi:hypothetical protein